MINNPEVLKKLSEFLITIVETYKIDENKRCSLSLSFINEGNQKIRVKNINIYEDNIKQ